MPWASVELDYLQSSCQTLIIFSDRRLFGECDIFNRAGVSKIWTGAHSGTNNVGKSDKVTVHQQDCL